MVRDIVLFLGAGFSSDAGLPTMSDFHKASQKELKALEDHEKRGDKAAATLLCEAGRKYMEFYEYCRKAHDHLNVEAENMEALFSVAEVLLHTGTRVAGFESASSLYRKIKLWLWKVYQQCPPMSEEDGCPKQKLYLDFMKRLHPVMDRLVVITTNYDVVWETLLWKSGVKSCYPFSVAPDPVDLIAEEGEDKEHHSVPPERAFVETYDNGQGPLVCKLHGSVNYFTKAEDRDGGIAPRWFGISRRVCQKTKAIHESGIEGHPEILGLDTIHEFSVHQGWEPEFVPPTYAKLTSSAWLGETWQAAIGALQSAKKVIFVGYSMPESDGFMKAMFRSAFAGRAVPRPELHLFDPDPAPDPADRVLPRYERLFREGRIKPHKKTFEKSVDEIVAICNPPPA